MNARNFSIIRPNLKNDGTFSNPDPRYQMINDTGVYRLTMMAWTLEGRQISKIVYGSYDDLMKIYDANRGVYRVLAEVQVLEDGTTDTITFYYNVNVNAIVAEEFQFAEVA